MSETIVVPDNSGNNMLPWLAMGNNGGFGGFGGNTIGDLIGLAIVASIFGWGGNGFGGLGNNGNGAAGFLSNQINNDAGRELIMQAVNSNGEAVAYVGGELARSMQPIAARLMCPTCG